MYCKSVLFCVIFVDIDKIDFWGVLKMLFYSSHLCMCQNVMCQNECMCLVGDSINIGRFSVLCSVSDSAAS